MNRTGERPPIIDAYGLSRPVAAEVRLSILRIFGEDGDDVWARLCDGAGVPTTGLSDDQCARLIDHMATATDGAVRLSAQSFLIRLRSFQHLSIAQQIVRTAS